MSDPWIAEVDAALRRRIADADAQPDFLDVVARARALDPEAFDDEALQQAEALQRAHADAPALDDGPLDAWLDDARLAFIDVGIPRSDCRVLVVLTDGEGEILEVVESHEGLAHYGLYDTVVAKE